MSWGISQRDLESHVPVYNEFLAMKRAVASARAGKGCMTCGGRNVDHASRMHDGTIRVLCRGCKENQEKVSRFLSDTRARLEAVEKRRRSL